ncbi:ABC transporter permease [Candidatus Microgenomates bacterium]|nr:ABC transporter permease [Candidatus Microgenomates bacterium]
MNASLTRIKALLIQDLYQTRHSSEVIIDVIVFPLTNVILFGYISLYLLRNSTTIPTHSLLLAAILWESLRVLQYTVTFGTLWNLWSRNLTNVMISPISVSEFFTAFTLAGVLKVSVLFLIMLVLAATLFGMPVSAPFAVNLLFYFMNLMLSGLAFGIFVTGMIFKWGTKINSLAWGLIYFFQPISGVYFPVSVLPEPLRSIAYVVPMTYVFESARSHLHSPRIDWQNLGMAFLINMLYLSIASFAFKRYYTASRMTGQFARNEG